MKKEKAHDAVPIISSPVNIRSNELPPLKVNSQSIMKRRNSYSMMFPSCLEKHHSSKQEDLRQQSEILEWDSVIWIGDFNYRINATNSSIVRMLIENNEWNILEAIDQLTIEKKIKRVAVGFNEGKINFAPTFKFKSQTSTYNIKRQPSWTDRILYRCKDNVLQLVNYESNNNVQMSDHRPVFA
jgi:endonuclease/exonuclease/phosphatase family metal-dependent hydrolase